MVRVKEFKEDFDTGGKISLLISKACFGSSVNISTSVGSSNSHQKATGIIKQGGVDVKGSK